MPDTNSAVAAAIRLFDGDLELLDYDSICTIVDALGDESNRLELKGEWIDKSRMALEACSIANADGGVIVVGFSDPKAGCVPQPGLDISPKQMLSVVASLSARVSPTIHVRVRTFAGPDGHNVAVIFVPRSFPGVVHEFLSREQSINLPIRRERAGIAPMSLAEVRYKLSEPANGAWHDDSLVASAPWHTNMLPEDVIGVECTPIDRHGDLAQFTREVDTTLAKGYPHESETTPLASGVLYQSGASEAYILRDGRIGVKMVWEYHLARSDFEQLFEVLFSTYCFASHAYYELTLGPRAHMAVVWRTMRPLPDRTFEKRVFPDYGRGTYYVDFSRDRFSDFAAPAVIDAERSTGEGRKTSDIQDDLVRFWDGKVSQRIVRDDIRDRWL